MSSSEGHLKKISEWIKFYRDLGFNIMPLKTLPDEVKEPDDKKRPLLKEWKHLQTRMATDEEIAEWFSKPRNIAVICGKISGNLVVVDFDREGVYEKFVKPDIEKRTLVSKPSKGRHVWLRSSIPVDSFKIPELGIDVQAEGKYVVAPPSIHPSGHVYEFVNPQVKNVMTVTDLEEAIWKKAQALGVKRPESLFLQKGDLPCIKVLLKGVEGPKDKEPGLRNEAAMRLAAYWLYFRHETEQLTREMLWRWNKRNRPPLSDRELKAVMKSVHKGGYEYGCTGMKEIGVCNPELEKICPLKDRLKIKFLKIVRTPFAELSDGRLAEQGYDGKKVYYIVYDPKTQKIAQENVIVNNDIRYEPIDNEDVTNGIVFLPSEATEYGTDEKLTDETAVFMDRWHEQNNRFQREFDVYYSRTTYIYDLLPEICYRRALARFGRGKTAFITVLGAICYRGILLAGCDTTAALRRCFDMWRGTAIIDEADFSKSDLFAVIIKILNIGWSSLLGWHKMADESDPRKTITSRVYGPKVLATRKRFEDMATESRCATCISRENIGKIPLFRSKKFLAEAQELRNKYLLWRFRHYHELKEKIANLMEDPEVSKKIYGEEIDVRSRVLQVVVPLGLVASEKMKKSLIDFAYGFDEMLDTLDPDAILDKEIEQAVMELLDKAETVTSIPKKYRRGEHREQREQTYYYPMRKILIKDIALKIDPTLKEKDKETVGRLRGFCKKIASVFRDDYEFHLERSTNREVKSLEVYLPAYYVNALKKKMAGDSNRCVLSVPSVLPLVFRSIPFGEVMPLCEFCPPKKKKQAAWYKVERDENGNEILRPICHECKAKFVEVGPR